MLFNDLEFANFVNQPIGGYYKLKIFEKTKLKDDFSFRLKTKIDLALIESTVSILTKYLLVGSTTAAFKNVLIGIRKYCEITNKNKKDFKNIVNGLSLINGLNTQSIYVTLQLSQFERYFRRSSPRYSEIEKLNIPESLYEPIYYMVLRCVNFFKDKGPFIKVNYGFPNGKPKGLSQANADIITKTDIWEIKISNSKPSNQDRLLLGLHLNLLRNCPQTKNILVDKIGIFNPLKNISYVKNLKSLTDGYMVFESILLDSPLYSNLNYDFDDEFYNHEISGKDVVDKITDIFEKTNDIVDFLNQL